MIKTTRRVLCLDWDKRALRIVVARVSGGKMVLEDAHSHRLPNTIDADEPQAMGDFIQQMLRRHHLRSKWVLVDVPRERAVINRITLPPTPTDEVAAAVRFQAMRELPFPVDTAAIDYVITGRDEQGQVVEVLLAAVTLETLDKIRATCEAAGLTPARIGLRPYANLVSAARVKNLEERRVLFVDVGPGATEIDVFAGDALAFARSANVNVPVPTREPGGREDSRIISLAEIGEYESCDEAIDAAVNELLVEVTRTLQAHRATDAEAVLDAVIVAGGTGIEAQFADALESRLDIPAELFDPTEPLGVEPAEAGKLRSFSAALGLAWGLGRQGMLALDFLNPKRPVSSREVLRRRVRLGALAAAVVLVAAGGAYGRYYWGLTQQLGRLETATKSLRKKVEQKREVKEQIDAASGWALEAVWPEELLAITSAAIDPGKKMLVQRIDMECTRRAQRVTLSDVLASDFEVPGDFVRKLNELETGGKPVYDATYLDWEEVSNRAEFTGTTNVQVVLRRLQEQRAKLEKSGKKGKRRKSR